MPLISFHSSTMVRSRSPAAFHCDEDSAIVSASTTRASFLAIASARAASRASASSPILASAAVISATNWASRDARSPTAATVGSDACKVIACDLVALGSPAPDSSRLVSRPISVCRSSNLRM